MLYDRLAGTERSGNGRRAALRHREHGINDTLSGVQGTGRCVFLLIGAADTHGPVLDHADLQLFSVRERNTGHGLVNRKFTLLDPLQHTASGPGRQHDLMQDRGCLLDSSDHVSADQLGAFLYDGNKFPFLFSVQCRDADTSCDGISCRLLDLRKRSLDTVIDILQHAGSQFHRQGKPCGDHLCAGAEA